MKVTMESTAIVTEIDGVPVRFWRGVSEGGSKLLIFVHRVAVDVDQDHTEVARDLVEHLGPVERFLPLAVLLEFEAGGG